MITKRVLKKLYSVVSRDKRAKNKLVLKKNKSLLQKDIQNVNLTPKSYPTRIIIALSNVCNYACPMCSMPYKLRKNNIRKVNNNISLAQIEAFSELFKRTKQVGFMGLFGESILNPEFIPIIRYLRSHYKIRLFVSTNGFGVHEDLQEALVDTGFDAMNFSIHAATPETYRILQAKHFDEVIANLKSLQRKKELQQVSKPHVTIVYALNKANIHEAKDMLDLAQHLNVDALHLYHYRDYGLSEYALDNDVEFANRMIDEIYAYAKEKNALALLPQNPPYFKEYHFEEEQENCERQCFLPWTDLQLRSSYSHRDSYYVGCCNVFNGFLLNYKQHIDTYGKVDFRRIWHHPIFQYLRKTVNTTPTHTRNPLCQYCKSRKRDYLKNVDNKKNYKIKLHVIDEFFRELKKDYPHVEDIEHIEGLEVLYTEDQELRALA